MAKSSGKQLVLDVGTANIRLVRAARVAPGDIDLSLYLTAPTPKDLVVSTFVEYPLVDAEPVQRVFTDIIKQAKVPYESIVLLLPDHASLITTLLAPPRYSKKEQIDAIYEDLGPVMQLPPESWIVSHMPVGVHEEDEITLAIATLRANLLELGGLVQTAGLNPYTIDINYFNMANCIEHWLTNSENKGKNIALVLLGNETTSIGLFKDGGLRSFMNRPIGGYDFTKQISKHHHTSIPDAEQFKRSADEIFFLPEFGPEQDKVYNFNVIRAQFTELVREIFAAIENYLTRFREFTIHEVIIGGGGANFPNIAVPLAQNLNAPVRLIGDCFQLTINGSPADTATKNELAVACGAYLRS